MPVPAKLVKLLVLWQLSQAAPRYGICPPLAPGDGGCIGTTPAKLIPGAWHVAQPVTMPVWFITPDPGAVLPPAWHSVQAWVVGRWLAGLPPVTPVVNDVVELWQLEHSPLGGWLGSCAVVGRVTIVTPVKLLPSS